MQIDLILNLFLIFFLSSGIGLLFQRKFNFITPQFGLCILITISSVVIFINPISGDIVPKILLTLACLFSLLGFTKNYRTVLDLRNKNLLFIFIVPLFLTSLF